MNMRSTASCAIQEICSLSSHPTAQEAMYAFCVQNLTQRVKYGTAGSLGAKDRLYSFYLFSGAVTHDGTKGAYANLPAHYRLYAKEFMEFIRDHDMGEVWESPIRENVAYHPDHSNQVYIWMPDTDKLKEWFNAQPKPTMKEGWFFEKVPPPQCQGFVCSPSVSSGYHGCGKRITPAESVQLLYENGTSTGSILCSTCRLKYFKDEIEVPAELEAKLT